MVKIDTLFLTKMAKIPYPLVPHIPISPHPPAPLWALNATVNGHCLQMHTHSQLKYGCKPKSLIQDGHQQMCACQGNWLFQYKVVSI